MAGDFGRIGNCLFRAEARKFLKTGRPSTDSKDLPDELPLWDTGTRSSATICNPSAVSCASLRSRKALHAIRYVHSYEEPVIYVSEAWRTRATARKDSNPNRCGIASRDSWMVIRQRTHREPDWRHGTIIVLDACCFPSGAMEPMQESRMNGLHPKRSLTSFCLLAAVATPILAIASQIAAAPFYPGYSFTLQSGSMLGTRFSRHPWIFNTGELLTGIAALAAAFGLYRSFRRRANVLISGLIGFSVACIGVMTVKAGLFPMPDPRHNSWAILFDFMLITPHLMLIGLWKKGQSLGVRAFLICTIAFLLLLIPLAPSLGRGTLQRILDAAILVPVGVVGFYFWREPQGRSLGL